MSDKNNWEEISNDVNEVAKKIKNKIDSEDLVDDLKESFKATIQNTSEIFNSILTSVEKTVKDQEIKDETKSLIKKINIEFQNSVKDVPKNIKNIFEPNHLKKSKNSILSKKKINLYYSLVIDWVGSSIGRAGAF